MRRQTKSNGWRKKAKKPSEPFFVSRNFANADSAQQKIAMTQFAERRAADFSNILADFDSLFANVHPLSILSMIAGWGMLAGAGDDGVSQKGILTGISQHHIELLQALALRLPMEKWGTDLATPEDIQHAIDNIKGLADAFHERRLLLIDDEQSADGRTVSWLQERLRQHTQIVRNWGYERDVRRISSELFKTLDPLMHDRHGFSASNFLAVSQALETVVAERLNIRFQALKRIFRQKSVRQLVRVYHRDYPSFTGDPEEFLSIIPTGTSFEAVRAMLQSHADLSLARLLTVGAQEISDYTGMHEDEVVLILDRLSHKVGALNDKNPEHLFMANPVWLQPGINLESAYFFAAPSSIFSFIFPIMRKLCDTSKLKAALEDRRSSYLETAVEAAFKAAFPGAAFKPNAKWTWQSIPYETDLLFTYDRTIFIVEAKSHALSDAAMRGAPDSVRDRVEKLIVDPAQQSSRLAAIIRAAAHGDVDALSAVGHLPFDPSQIDHIARASITLDDFSVLASAENELNEAGWVPDDLKLAPTLCLADLVVVLDILGSPLFIIDYFLERERLQKAIPIIGDELDFLGLYLHNGFNLSAVENDVEILSISGMSEKIDHYCMSRDANIVVPKPRPTLGPYFRQLLNTLEERAPPGWTSMGLLLLHLVEPGMHKQFEGALEKLKRTVAKQYRDTSHTNAIIATPPNPLATLGLFYMHSTKSGRDHKKIASQLAAEAMERERYDQCIIVVRFIENTNTPYDLIAITKSHR